MKRAVTHAHQIRRLGYDCRHIISCWCQIAYQNCFLHRILYKKNILVIVFPTDYDFQASYRYVEASKTFKTLQNNRIRLWQVRELKNYMSVILFFMKKKASNFACSAPEVSWNKAFFFFPSLFIYVKFFAVWILVLTADFLLEFRFEYLWPFWLLMRSAYDSFKYQGLVIIMNLYFPKPT